MTINYLSKKIELTSDEMKKASVCGSEEYKNLLEVRRDNVGFEVVEVKSKKRKADDSGVDMKYIKGYVAKNGTDVQKRNLEFLTKTTVDDEGNYHEPQSFFQIKRWFFNEFPEIKKQRKEYRDKVLKIYEAADAKAEAAKAEAAKATEEEAAA